MRMMGSTVMRFTLLSGTVAMSMVLAAGNGVVKPAKTGAR
jgi:hypothetical protein